MHFGLKWGQICTVSVLQPPCSLRKTAIPVREVQKWPLREPFLCKICGNIFPPEVFGICLAKCNQQKVSLFWPKKNCGRDCPELIFATTHCTLLVLIASAHLKSGIFQMMICQIAKADDVRLCKQKKIRKNCFDGKNH